MSRVDAEYDIDYDGKRGWGGGYLFVFSALLLHMI
jgi:hypothetical protein